MINLTINGGSHALDIDPRMPLLWAIRDHAGLTGTKYSCGMAQCGSCIVYLDGEPVRSCITPASAAEGRQVTTIDRDQSHTLKAKEEFERLVKKYPRSEYTEPARAKIRQCYIYLAEYELYVGNFYFKMERYQAAMDRYRYLLEHYPDFGQYHQALENYRICQERLPLQPEEEPETERKPSWWKRFTRSVGSFSDKIIEGVKGIF